MATSIKIIRKNKIRADGTFPIMIQIIKDGKTKLITTGITCLENEWEGEQLKKVHTNYQKRNLILSNIKNKALKIIDDFVTDEIDFTLSDFERKFNGEKANTKTTVYEHFQEKINLMDLSGRTGNARSYRDTCNSFFNFHSDKQLGFRNLNVTLLEKYEAHLRSRNNQDSGIAFRMRSIRAIYNSAIRNGIVKKEYYPFDKYKISKLKGKGMKRALSREEIKKILDVDLSERPDLIDAKNYFVFSYFARGINFVDLMKLKKENIQGDNIEYIRSKTKGRFIIKIMQPVQEVLDYYATKNSLTDYVFPILLKNDLTPIQIENRKHKTLSKFNKDLKQLALLAKVDKNVTSYVIRHSFATNLKQLGVATDLISTSMGHSNLEITQSYLKEFENNIIDDANEKLLNFNN
ncbi:transposase [Flavobacterium psychrophilum]|uniref:site-specific integrase n=1 Tax=Flavobacterium psychrophilum TaxID=96345 RepID=UPI000B7C0A66|nr:site-specific integrase [Flavobacterium psychrophilum]SNB31324.1 transposase [Flavobacterium psychrophilum]